ncbi:RNA polymerase subunit sigma-24 [Thermosipho melanesiensis]|uniref:RNA polymerase, sigma-24 subunit, ECF subfamily n=2 Tax=Thermosipho melanesiensis TaxID=46541 RepID=A6LLW8_THEM4|nr:sigma factor [Thermosipho melanesiensis]ABR30919.1 RNA polymerase, sigma-24 subunit, ECF subfamily [Thermosipho melanesiensis BI429]APT74036.1 RNA polymerase subunit sigma-24 [Thermosipho melanesiensis]OOC35964.1 RNA polymerase subunit sigma-24 [Thermosipho melanesiensis]OOC38103.1 RNA polymerase subunit sigma-24 [Thermosipho melanesiensis]OOC38233.1 RNA polymerase subunit sigma-24 [Thermosipho melanesiensis]
MGIYEKYKEDVKQITGKYYKKYKRKICSYEDLYQTVWYILLAGLKVFDGRGDERKFLLLFIKNKLISILNYNRKPPYCINYPFTPLNIEYISADNDKNKYFMEIHGDFSRK